MGSGNAQEPNGRPAPVAAAPGQKTPLRSAVGSAPKPVSRNPEQSRGATPSQSSAQAPTQGNSAATGMMKKKNFRKFSFILPSVESPVFITMSETTKFDKAYEVATKKIEEHKLRSYEVKKSEVILEFDGERLGFEQCPKDLHMDDYDQIDVKIRPKKTAAKQPPTKTEIPSTATRPISGRQRAVADRVAVSSECFGDRRMMEAPAHRTDRFPASRSSRPVRGFSEDTGPTRRGRRGQPAVGRQRAAGPGSEILSTATRPERGWEGKVAIKGGKPLLYYGNRMQLDNGMHDQDKEHITPSEMKFKNWGLIQEYWHFIENALNLWIHGNDHSIRVLEIFPKEKNNVWKIVEKKMTRELKRGKIGVVEKEEDSAIIEQIFLWGNFGNGEEPWQNYMPLKLSLYLRKTLKPSQLYVIIIYYTKQHGKALYQRRSGAVNNGARSAEVPSEQTSDTRIQRRPEEMVGSKAEEKKVEPIEESTGTRKRPLSEPAPVPQKRSRTVAPETSTSHNDGVASSGRKTVPDGNDQAVNNPEVTTPMVIEPSREHDHVRPVEQDPTPNQRNPEGSTNVSQIPNSNKLVDDDNSDSSDEPIILREPTPDSKHVPVDYSAGTRLEAKRHMTWERCTIDRVHKDILQDPRRDLFDVTMEDGSKSLVPRSRLRPLTSSQLAEEREELTNPQSQHSMREEI